ncbi:MAG: substrate-binding domain-containing protein [Herbinix sp.]|nr:substrate-binding domain-containing protein [Herbinix sp.]
MKSKKLIFDIGVIVIAFLLFTIWYNHCEKDKALTTSTLNHFYKIYLITITKDSQYWQYINEGATDMAAALGVTYIWEVPTEMTVAKQIEVINNAVNDGANAILVAADEPKRISSAIEDAKARGVKVIYVDSPAYEEAITTLSTDNYAAGVLAGETMLEELGKLSINEGAIGIISVENKLNTELRDNGFREIIEADGRFRLVDTVYTNGEVINAQAAAERVINENEDLVGLFGANQGTSEGVGMAIRADNNRIVGVGFDKTDTMLMLLKEGSLKAVMLQNPYTMGYLGMAEAIAAIKGFDTGPSYLNTGVTVLRSDQ